MVGRLILILALPASAVAQSSSGGYIVTQGGAEIVRERFSFDGVELTSVMQITSARLIIRGTTRYDDVLAPLEFVASGHTHVDSAAFQTLEVVFDDSATFRVTGANPQTGSTLLTRPYSVFRNLGFSHLAVTLLRYDRQRGGRQEIQLWVPDGAVVIPLVMELSGSGGQLELQGIPVIVETSPEGWLRRAEIPLQGVVVEWMDDVEIGGIQTSSEAPLELPATVGESTHAFVSGGLTLEGTLTVPKTVSEPIPIGVVVAGSGPTDRNGDSPPSLRTGMYRQLAWRLAERGIATFRYDKRGVGKTRGTFDPSETTFEDFALDAQAAVASLAEDARFSKIVIIGHSEGARLATVATNNGAAVAGIVSLAGAGRPVLTVLREQLARQLDSAMLHQYDSLMTLYLDGVELQAVPPVLRVLLVPINRRFMQTSVAYDAADQMARVQVPVLIVQGETDLQISVLDAEALAIARPEARVVVIQEANHVFKRTPSTVLAGQMTTYIDPSLPIVPELIDAIVDWMSQLP